MVTNKSKKPELRFKGFSDDWEQSKFFEIAQRESLVRFSTADFPSVEYEDVSPETGTLNKDIQSKEIEKKGFTFDNDNILYGKLRPYLHNWLNPNFSGVAVGDWWVLKPIRVDKNFLYMLIQTQKFDNIANQSAGSKMPRADWNHVSNASFMIPKNIDEQRRIGSYFESLDNLITLHQSKCDKLKIIKKLMLNNLFPKNGEKNPKWRFNGFNDDWEQRKLGDILLEHSIRTSDFENNPLYSLTIESGVIPKTDRYERSSLVTKKEDLFKVVKPNEFVTNPMNLRFGALGYNTNPFNVSVSGYYDVFSIDDDKCSGFWNSFFKTPIAMKIFDNAATGSLI